MRERFTVATFNIGDYHPEAANLPQEERVRANPPIGSLSDIVRRLEFDYLMMQEAPSADYVEELARRSDVPYHEFRQFYGSIGPGLGFLGSSPFGPLSLDIEWPENLVMGAAAVQIAVSGHSVGLCNVHLPPVEKSRDDEGFVRVGPFELAGIIHREVFSQTDRSVGVEALLEALRSVPVDGMIVGGDFNTVFLSRAVRRMRTDYTDTMGGRRGFFATSYSKSRGILPARVDYLFYRGDLVPLDARIIRETAGDHFPVVTTFSYAR